MNVQKFGLNSNLIRDAICELARGPKLEEPLDWRSHLEIELVVVVVLMVVSNFFRFKLVEMTDRLGLGQARQLSSKQASPSWVTSRVQDLNLKFTNSTKTKFNTNSHLHVQMLTF